MRRSAAVTAWCLATVGASALAWSAVDRVAADVTDHTTVVGDRAIRTALDRDRVRPFGGPGTGATSATTPGAPPVGNASADTAPTGGPAGGASGPPAGRGTNGPPPAGGTDVAPPPAPTTTTTTTPPAADASVVVLGGSVTATCSSGAPRLVRAIPNSGYGVRVGGGGQQLVVDLTSATHLSVVEAECEGNHVQFSTSEESTG